MKFLVVCVLGSVLLFWVAGLLWLGTYNEIDFAERNVVASWATIQNLYQIRLDHISDLSLEIGDYLGAGDKSCENLIELRSKIEGKNFQPEDLTKDQVVRQEFLANQRALTKNLDDLLAWADNYPELALDQSFVTLKAKIKRNLSFIKSAEIDSRTVTKTYNQNCQSWLGRRVAWYYGFGLNTPFLASP